MIRLDAVELAPGHRRDPLVGQAEALQHDGLGVLGHARDGPGVEGELHVGEHASRVALGDEQRAPLPRRLHGEAVAVDDPHAGGQGVEAETHPRQVEERQGRHHHRVDPLVGQQQLDGALGNQRRSGNGVEHAAGPGFGTAGRADPCPRIV